MNFNIRAIVSTESKRTVEHQLHIARTRSLCSRERNLLGNFSGGHKQLGERYAVILEEDNLKLLAENRVVLELLADAPNHLDNLLCDIVAGRSLCRENIGFRNKRCVRVLLEEVVVRDNVHRVELLALVLVQTLNLYIKNAVNIQLCARRFLNVLRETLLVFTLDFAESLENRSVVCENLELDELGSVLLEALADALGEQVGKSLVALEQPAAVSDTVGDVLELIGLVESLLTENVVLDNLAVKL